jgi:hypothetical protein
MNWITSLADPMWIRVSCKVRVRISLYFARAISRATADGPLRDRSRSASRAGPIFFCHMSRRLSHSDLWISQRPIEIAFPRPFHPMPSGRRSVRMRPFADTFCNERVNDFTQPAA